MKLLLVQPSQLHQDGNAKKLKRVFNIPLSVYLLAGLTPKEWDIRIVNDYTDEMLYDDPVDLVGITATTLHSHRGFEIAEEFRKRGKKVVMGGFHPTLFTEEARQHCDAVVVGEAEHVWEKCLDDFKNDRLQPVYQAEGFCDLAGMPVPRFDLIELRKFKNKVIPVESTRGCPYNCDYCSVTRFYGSKFRNRPVADVVRDIKATKSPFIGFVDDNIAGRASYCYELFEALVPLKIYWMSQVSIRLADDEKLLELAARSGFRYAIVGIETLDEGNLDSVGKKSVNNVEDYVRKSKLFEKYGITIAANLMFGFDNDTPETFEKTYKFVLQNYYVPNPYILTPYPGTPLFNQYREAGRMLHFDFRKYNAYTTVFRPKNFTPEELDRLFNKFSRRVYSIPNILKRFFHHLDRRFPFGSFMTQLAVALSSLTVRANIRKGLLPYY
jgi:radical SAM superfamily enzyme YgiQ (UPF0313 family)